MLKEEQIKKHLNNCYKKRQPVLLHGEDNIGRLNLILGIHIDNGGIIDAVQYISVKDDPGSEVFLEKIGNEIEEAEKDWFATVVPRKYSSEKDFTNNLLARNHFA